MKIVQTWMVPNRYHFNAEESGVVSSFPRSAVRD